MIITANEVKKSGVSIFKNLLDKFSEVIITNRGKKEFVVIDYQRYKEFREYELEKAYKEVIEDVESGDYEVLTPKEHIEKLKKELDVNV